MNMVFTMGFRVQIFGRRCALEPAFFFIKRQYTEQLTDKQGEQFTEDSISQKQYIIRSRGCCCKKCSHKARALCVQNGSLAGSETRIACSEKEAVFRDVKLL